jgi:hypothetical protein
MPKSGPSTGLRKTGDVIRHPFGHLKRGCALEFRILFVGVIVLLNLALTSIRIRAQDGSAAEADRNRAVEIPRNTPDSDDSADGRADPDGADALQGDTQSAPNGPAGFEDTSPFASNDDFYEAPIGTLLQHDCAKLATGQMACGLAVLEVRPGSPAALAGIRPYSGLVHTMMGATVMGAGMVFPPALAALGLVEQTRFGETFDLIIAVDGQRVRVIPDFEHAIAEARLGDIIYLTILRHGQRLQLPVKVAQYLH